MGLTISHSQDTLMTCISDPVTPMKRGPDNFGLTRKEMKTMYWTTLCVHEWLSEINMTRYQKCFEEHDIDGEALNLLNDIQLKRIMGGGSEEDLTKMRELLSLHDQRCQENDITSGPTTSSTVRTPELALLSFSSENAC
ncbi:hypothetical protein AKO1_005598 [Acrasis kona]|uniref:SAM domain-containing protein n=1 Tax=Acrasis kona TaxID=1008807 RepID=A0AAW2YIV3_9EUKA